MWPLVSLGVAFAAVIATVDYLLLPQFVSHSPESRPAGGGESGARFRLGAFPVCLLLTTALGYAFFAGYEALSAHGSDAPVFTSVLVAGVIYEIVTRNLPGKPHLTGLPRSGVTIGMFLGMGLWLVLHW